MEKRKLVLNKLMIAGFLGYVLILLVERILAIVLSVNTSSTTLALTSGDGFAIATYTITCISVLAGVILLIKPIYQLLKVTFKKDLFDFTTNSKQLIIASMVLLVSGMMHTGYTLAGLQFAAYGLLIVSIIARGIEAIYEGKDKFVVISSLIFIVCFSMAIPVCYYTKLGAPLGLIFFIVEFVTVFALIPIFTYMLINFFKEGIHRFDVCTIFAMMLLSGLTVGLKWQEEVNWFLFIFVCVTALVYFTIGLISRSKIKKAK